VEGFYRTDAEGFSATFAGCVTDSEQVQRQSREEGLYAQSGPEPVDILVGEGGDVPGSCMGTVVIARDN
jgi:hypothetical protein